VKLSACVEQVYFGDDLMKKIKWLVASCLLVVVMNGCAVYMSPTYSRLLDKTTSWSAEVSTRAEQGKLSEAEQVKALSANAALWQKFKNAKDGVK